MKELKRNLLSTTVISAVVAVGLGVGGAALVATGSALAACGAKAACNPCAAKKKQCNPCAAKKGCNPCATKKKKGASLDSFQGREIQVAACSPCATKKKCNPCAAKKGCNPCATKKKKGASFDSFQGREIQVAACSPCATKKKCNPCAAKKGCNPCAAKKGCNPCATKKKGSIRESYASPCYGGGETGPVIGAGGEADEVEPAQVVVQIAGGDAAAGTQEVLQPAVAAVHRLHMQIAPNPFPHRAVECFVAHPERSGARWVARATVGDQQGVLRGPETLCRITERMSRMDAS